ncbi:MAG TPA: hypothetical protein V6D22_13935 [Candidatus Obscuribacterales bacterium]
MKSVLTGLTLAALTVGIGLAFAPSASACGNVLTQPAIIDSGFTTLSQPAVIDNSSTILSQPAVIDTGLTGCNTLCQPAVVAPACPALAPVYGATGFWHRPLFLGGTPVDAGYLTPNVMPRTGFYEGALFGHGWYY